jgi:hypothetical protein
MWSATPNMSASNASVLNALNNNHNQRNANARNPASNNFFPTLLNNMPTRFNNIHQNNVQQQQQQQTAAELESNSQSSQTTSSYQSLPPSPIPKRAKKTAHAETAAAAVYFSAVTSRAKLAASSAAAGVAKSDAVNAAVTALVNSSAAHTPHRAHVVAYPPTMLEADYAPSDNDVCCGRGKQNWNMKGNIYYRKVVRDAVDAYVRAGPSLKHKLAVVASIVDEIRKQGGHFLKEGKKPVDQREEDDDTDGFFWYDIGDAAARGKVGHSLRDTLGKSSSHSVSAHAAHALSNSRPSQEVLKNKSPLELAKLAHKRNKAARAAAAKEDEPKIPQGQDPVVTASFNAWLLHQQQQQLAARTGQPQHAPPAQHAPAPVRPPAPPRPPPQPQEVGSAVTQAAFNAWLSTQQPHHPPVPPAPPAPVRPPQPPHQNAATSAAMNAWLLQQKHQPGVTQGMQHPPSKTAPLSAPPRQYALPPQHPLSHLFPPGATAPQPAPPQHAPPPAPPQHVFPVHIPVPVPVPYYPGAGAYPSYPGAYAGAGTGPSANPYGSLQSPPPSSLYSPPPTAPPPQFADYRSLLESTQGEYSSYAASAHAGAPPAPPTSTPFPYAAYAALAEYRASQTQPPPPAPQRPY